MLNKKASVKLVWLFFLVINLPLAAQQKKKAADSTVLQTIILKSPLLENNNLQTPAAISQIDEKSLTKGNTQLLTESFNYQPGIFVQTGALNTSKISIRGIGSRAQYGTNRIKAYFNEIPLTTADGQSVLNDFDVNAIQNVEIVKGPNASLYGAGLGGLVQLQAKKSTKNSAEATTRFGSFGLRKNALTVQLSENNLDGFISFTDLHNKGFRENSQYDRKNLTTNFTLSQSVNSKLEFLGIFTRLKAFIPSSLSKKKLDENPGQAAYTWKKARGYEAYDRFLMGLSFSHNLNSKLKNTTSVFTNWRDAYEPRPFDILKEKRWGIGARTRFNYKNTLAGFPTKISFGAETLFENYDQENFENLYEEFEDSGSVRGNPINNLQQERIYLNLFAQTEIKLTKRFKLTAGLNFNTTKYSLTDFYKQDNINQTGTYAFKNIWSPRLAGLYQLDETKSFYATISNGFSIPSFSESLTPEGIINTNLKPEIGWNYEIGFKASWFSKLYTEINLYSIQVTDLLVAKRVAEDRYVGVNAGKTAHNGIEWMLRYQWRLGTNFSLEPVFSGNFNAYRFKEFTDRGENYNDNALTGVPKTKMNIALNARWKNIVLQSNFLNVSEIPVNDANTVYTDAYQLLNLKANYTWQVNTAFHINLHAGVTNLLDTDYAASFVPNAVGFGDNEPRYFYPGMPRNFYGGVRLKYLW